MASDQNIAPQQNINSAANSSFATVVGTMRLPFLLLTLACLLLAFSLAYKNTESLQWHLIVLISIGALCAHISVNMLNEYADFSSGLDLHTQRTPFSGGSGALVAQPAAKRTVLVFACINLLICCSIGLFFTFTAGREILSIGLLGVVIVITYTKWINRFPFLCLIAPGLAFGVLLVNGSYFVLTGSFQIDVIMISLLPFFVVNNLLLLNQFPDIKADLVHGRNHWLIKYGVSSGVYVYLTMAVFSLVTLGLLVFFDYLPLISAITLPPILIGIYLGIKLNRITKDSKDTPSNEELTPLMGGNVAITISIPVLLGISVLIDSFYQQSW
ncbi:UbiA prenyltransferase [Glaciecola nitratireducens FR1064]|uniref:UbiA prenyltransferase n=1 Tax=Glaciecola nitratireducens (strain JCM 12485 / KCTC 12276 / FR1064) TaxID=1085623 RepID=G4QEK2_GLANF|nr:UbiA prenyltransferase [Glaciecola nitratireducens FR1064]